MTEVNMFEFLATTAELTEKKLGKSFEQEPMIFNEFKKLPHVRTNQKGRIFPIYTSPNPAINWRGESGAYPGGGTHKAKQMRVFYARPGISRRMSGDVLDLGEDAIIDAFTDGMDMDYDTLMKDMNQEIFGDGTGTKAVLGTVASNPVFALSVPRGATFLLDNGRYQIFNPSTGVARSSQILLVAENGVDRTALTVTFTTTASGSPQIGDVIAWENSYLNSLTGLENLVDNGTGDFQGVSRGDAHSLKSPNLDAAGARLGLSKIDQQELQVIIRAGKMGSTKKHVYVTHPTQLQAYRELGRNYQEYQSGTKFDGGNGGIENQAANGRQIWIDVDSKNTDWWLLDFNAFVVCELAKLGLVNKDGQRLRMIPAFQADGASGSHLDSYIYYVEAKFDVGLLLPQNCSRMFSLDTTGLVSPHFA